MVTLYSILTYCRFAWGLREFLKEPITLEQSRQVIKQRLAEREDNLLSIVKKAIYEHKASPYLKLLRLAGCEYGDFEKIVRSEGVEASLKKIADEGVFISIEEFKGKKDVIRGGKAFRFKERDFDNPYLSGHLQASSGASRSAGTRTVFDFNYMTQILTVYHLQLLNAFNALDLPFALWYPISPGPGPVTVLSHTKGDITPVNWFSQVEKSGFKPSLRSRMATNYIVYMGRIFGSKLPKPEYVPLDNAWEVAKWMADTSKVKGGCCLHTYTSAAVRICQAAREKGLDITGAKFIVSGEPLTEVKREEIESTTGAALCPMYAFTEAGVVGIGCFNPIVADDVHLLKESFALIQKPREVPHAGITVDAFLFTTLSLLAPKILLNEETGDYGIIKTRECSCKLEELGFTDHVYNIRGFDKLTGEGMTFIGTDLVNIIEKVLPDKFGGFSTDYQMVEEEDEEGHTRMSIIVSPEIDTLNEDEIIQTIIAELGKGSDAQRMMSEMWSQAKTLRVKRIRPIATARGKLLPLHIRKNK